MLSICLNLQAWSILTTAILSIDQEDPPPKKYHASSKEVMKTRHNSRRPIVRISHTLHPIGAPDSPFRYNNAFNPYYKCDPTQRLALPEPIQRQLNFTTTVSTNLKILIMGDSVGIQIFQGFEEAAGGTFANRQVLRYSWGTHEGLVLSAPVRGGGQVAGWRITGMLTKSGENMPLPNNSGGGWVREDATALLNHSLSMESNVELEHASPSRTTSTTNRTMGSFDCMVFRIPHGWIRLSQITQESLKQTVQLAHELFGVSTIVFVSMPFVNNVQTMQDLDDLKKANTVLREFALGWNSQNTSTTLTGGVQQVLVLEFGRLMDDLMEINARQMEYDTSNQNYTMEKLHSGKFPMSIPLVCGQRVETGTSQCGRNSVSLDGMHWCMESIGGRVFAGLSCLLGCAHNFPTDTPPPSTDIQCERRCNDQFMSLEKENTVMKYKQTA
jgi:hypothetical protein